PSSGTATDMKGWFASNDPTFNPNSNNNTGVYLPLTLGTANNAKYWVSNIVNTGSGNMFLDQINLTGAPVANCSHLNNTYLGDIGTIPASDIYGNPTTSTDISVAKIYKDFGSRAYNPAQPSNAYQMGLASWAATYNMAHTILNDSSLKITIYCIGYTG